MELEGFTKNEKKFIQKINKPHSKIEIVCIAFMCIFLAYMIIDIFYGLFKNYRLLYKLLYDHSEISDVAFGFFMLGFSLMLVAMSIRERFFTKIIKKLLRHNN